MYTEIVVAKATKASVHTLNSRHKWAGYKYTSPQSSGL